jgi:hypothetical protein
MRYSQNFDPESGRRDRPCWRLQRQRPSDRPVPRSRQGGSAANPGGAAIDMSAKMRSPAETRNAAGLLGRDWMVVIEVPEDDASRPMPITSSNTISSEPLGSPLNGLPRLPSFATARPPYPSRRPAKRVSGHLWVN